jgi:hypothetical protein
MTRKKLELPPEVLPPSRYVEKVSLLTGEVLDQDILPKQLLIHHHRDYHILDVYSRYLVSRAVQRTGKPEVVVQRMKAVRRMGQSAIDWFSTLIGDRPASSGRSSSDSRRRSTTSATSTPPPRTSGLWSR